MSLIEFRLDRAGIAEVLKSEPMRALVDGAAQQVAANARAALPEDGQVDVRPYTSDRQGATVLAVGHGGDPKKALTDAARAAGLEVTEH